MLADERRSGGAAAVVVADVQRRYRLGDDQQITALAGVSFSIASGSVVSLVGPSGSGKSTLLHLIGALDQPDAGAVQSVGIDLGRLSRRELADYRRRVGFVFQSFNLLSALSVLDNVMAPVLPFRTSFDPEQRARGLLASVGLAGREGSLPSRLSGGQQQRAAIARALINEPALVLADEPTGNLDSITGGEIIDLLLDLRSTRGITVLLATHDVQIASRCDRVLRLLDGRLVDDIDISACGDLQARLATPIEPIS